MKTTEKLMLQAMIISAVITGALYWWISDMHWGVYLGAWFFLSAVGYGEFVKHTANEKQANADDATRKQ
tara:strand:- start:4406 stop:4612 length:207 start_codon:yes stop_codon:yes gene_type:complete